MTKKLCTVLGLAVVLSSAPFEALTATTAIPSATSRVVSCTTEGSVCATVVSEPINGSMTRKGYRWGGEDIEPPQSVVAELTVAARGQDIFVPLSAYTDLGNPRAVEVVKTSRGFDVVVTGGDAATAYRALLVFEGRSLKRRKVQNGEFPNEAWEETRYKFNTLSN